ncbi:hypothetical protein OSG_eHP35_00005 [environmental Halophage eHP-35]|nr:hypothetical protein OSG_eHP35_00005 [environmental Halophage eHP-35]
MSGQVTLSTNDEAEALMDQLEDDIEKLFGGKSGYFRSCLMNYDDKHRIEAKIELINQRIEEKENEIEDLKLQRKGLESELEEMTVEDEEESESVVDVDDEFWDETVRKIFKRIDKDQPDSLKKRYNNWFDSRHQLYVNRYAEISSEEFKKRLLEKAEERGFETEVLQ